MRKLLRLISPLAAVLSMAIGLGTPALADDGNVAIVYFSGIGCHECEAASPVILGELTKEYPNLVVVDYEIYSETQNAAVLDQYVTGYGVAYHIPLAVFGKDLQLSGIDAISSDIKTVLGGLTYNAYPMADGTSVDFTDLDLDSLSGLPTIWHQAKVLIRGEGEGGGELAKKLLLNDNIAEILASEEYEVVEPVSIAIPGAEIKFDNAINIGGWVFQWNGAPITPVTPPPTPEPTPTIPIPPSQLAATTVSSSQIDLTWKDNSDNESGFRIEQKTGTDGFSQIASVGANVTSYSSMSLSAATTYTYRVIAYSGAGDSAFTNEATATTAAAAPAPNPAPTPTPPPAPAPQPAPSTGLTFAKIASLAAADAVNPCAFSVLLLLLVSIIAYNPGNRKSILFAGLAFTGVVFGMYFLYGLVFIRFFQLLQVLAPVRFGLFTALAIAAIVFGAFNIRDFVRYKPGGVGTEMPALLRPKVKKLLSNITSVRGAAIAGVLVTVFLLPCTIGPYIIAAGILSDYSMAANVPPLLLYNLIFILPFLGITGSVYLGLGKVQDVYKWKQKNITKLHLVAGILIMGLGIFMLLESLKVLSTGLFFS